MLIQAFPWEDEGQGGTRDHSSQDTWWPRFWAPSLLSQSQPPVPHTLYIYIIQGAGLLRVGPEKSASLGAV